ncbi:SagB family peptide dehydrogenase [Paenibacillus sp. sptzw28]|uniref:SagB family peptide dehydrogenase n=1 Tax=Paenibacillus sp. sptzw28 TaxID=715179 RepID=UPI001C6F5993|nr:SagB family peptide dehydrogenase [Paenibacillus sp. sptzw28]QYR20283.1 SagB family peptide dehydrogenase [Paenibacillus sp. sptzw28]
MREMFQDRPMCQTIQLYVRFTSYLSIRGTVDGPEAICRGLTIKLPKLEPYALSCLMRASDGSFWGYTETEEAILEREGWLSLSAWYRALSTLLEHRCLFIETLSCTSKQARAVLSSCGQASPHLWNRPQEHTPYRLSRFAYIRREEDGGLYISSTLYQSRVSALDTLAVQLFQLLSTPVSLADAAGRIPEWPKEEIGAVMTLLLWAGIISPTSQDGALYEDRHLPLIAWEFHDLLLHTRSRLQEDGVRRGGTYRFLHVVPPSPPAKPDLPPSSIPLYVPDMIRISREEESFAFVMENRVSGVERDRLHRHMDAEALGEFLFRTARIRMQYETVLFGQYTGRPYPNAGSCYELELYAAVRSCPGLPDGLYAYDPNGHALRPYAGADSEELFQEALSARPEMDPQVLIAITARFQRISWKYESIAYSLVLKNAGVLIAYFYLTASAMNIPSFALGTGSLSRLTMLTGTDPLQEFPVGEFVLGRPAAPPGF